MVKPPIVYTAGLLRAAGKGVDTEAWTWLCANAGQQLFFPPNVSGWNDERWLDTATYLARWDIAGRVTRNATLDPGKVQAPFDADKLLERALDFWGDPPISAATRRVLRGYTNRALATAGTASWKKSYPALIENPSPPDRGVPRLPDLLVAPPATSSWRAITRRRATLLSPRSSDLARQSASSGLVLAPQERGMSPRNH